MPDRFGFDHLPNWGTVTHRCIVEGCEFPGPGIVLTEAERERHHRAHTRPAERKRQKEIENTRLRNLAKARKARQTS